jgi:hypothetical protein
MAKTNRRIQRAHEIAGQAKRLGRAFPLPANQGSDRQLPSQRLDGGRHRFACVRRVERAADPVVEVRIADRDQTRQDQASAASAHEGFGHSSDGAVVR